MSITIVILADGAERNEFTPSRAFFFFQSRGGNNSISVFIFFFIEQKTQRRAENVSHKAAMFLPVR